jgi:nucleoside-diphosphate-sugar epimerase
MKILILGGTQMLGRDLVERLQDDINYDITLANRGITNPTLFPKLKHIKLDRNDKESCLVLSNNIYDYVLDFSCYNLTQFQNTCNSIRGNNYIYISTLGVFDVSDDNYLSNDTPYRRYINYCIDKKNIEKYISQTEFSYNMFIVRPCIIYGENDYTQRFEQRNNTYYWKGTNTKADEETNCVNVSVVTQKLVEILENKTENDRKKHTINIGKIPNAPVSTQ